MAWTSDTTIRCCVCQEVKPLSEIIKNRSKRDGLSHICLSCSSAWHREHYKRDRDKIAARKHKWRAENPEKKRAWDRKQRYGITQEEFGRLLEKQGHVCAICLEPFGDATPHVDHCHRSGKTRGLVHGNCNHLLGKAKENPLVLASAARYLERHQ